METFGVAAYGEDARFNPSERAIIRDPLARLIERYGNVAEQYSALIDPALVLVGIGLYAVRLSNLASEKSRLETKAAEKKMPPAAPAPNFNPAPPDVPFRNPLVYGRPVDEMITPDSWGIADEAMTSAIDPNDYMRPPEL